MSSRSSFFTGGRLAWLLAVPLVWSPFARAAEGDVENRLTIGVGGAYLDNVRHTATGQQDEIVGIAGTEFQLHTDRTRMEADFTGAFDYQRYSSSTYGGEFFGDFVGTVVLKILPDTVHWHFSDDFADVRSRAADADTPDAREHLNYFSTGPDLQLRLGDRTLAGVSGRFSDTHYSESSELDSQRRSGQVFIQRNLSMLSRVALNAERSVLEFAERDTNPDIHQEAAYLRFEIEGARTELGLDAGYSRSEQQKGGVRREGSLVRLSVSRRLTERSMLELRAGRIFTDAGDFLRLTEHRNFSNIDSQTIVPTANIFDSRHGMLVWSATLSRTIVRAVGEYHDERYAEASSPFDRSRIVARLRAQRRLSERMTLGVGGFYSYEDYENQEYRGDWIGCNLSLDWVVTRQMTASVEYAHGVRHSSKPEYRYTENRTWLRLIFNPLANR